jgi:hypothetical protein
MFARIVEMTSDPNQRDKTNEIFRYSILPAKQQASTVSSGLQ